MVNFLMRYKNAVVYHQKNKETAKFYHDMSLHHPLKYGVPLQSYMLVCRINQVCFGKH